MNADIDQFSEIVHQWLLTQGLALAWNFAVFALIILGGMVVARLVSRTVALAIDKSHLKPSPLFRQFAVNASRKSVFLLAFIVALGNLGIDTGALIAGLGVSGIVLGFALKDTLSNFAAGGLILLYQPFDVGHFVEVSGTSGSVQDLTLVATVLKTGDNKIITIPNSKVWGSSITNYSATDTRRVDIVAGIDYGSDIDQAIAILMGILEDHENVLETPAPQVRIRGLGDSSVDFNVRAWVQASDYWTVHADILREIKYRLDAAGIGIPFPQRDVWIHHAPSQTPDVAHANFAPSKPAEASVLSD